MNRFKGLPHLGLVLVLSILCSMSPFLFVAPLIRVAHSNYCRSTFWSSFLGVVGILAATGFVPVAINLLSITLLVGIFSELSNKQKSMFVAGFFAILASAATTVAATQQWLVSKGTNLTLQLQEIIQAITKLAQQTNPGFKLDADFAMAQVPSVFVALLIFNLALALIVERPLTRLMGFSGDKRVDLDLLNFKLPDSYIWIAMFSFLLSFIDIGPKYISTVATNIVNIMVILYFFQGLAVIEAFYRALRVGPVMRFISYLVILLQLFIIVAAIGLIDFWVEFRRRFIRIRLNP